MDERAEQPEARHGRRTVATIIATIIVLLAALWVLFAASLPLDGEPCWGDALNAVQKIMAGGGALVAVVAVAMAAEGRFRLWRWLTAGVALDCALWWVLLTVPSYAGC